MKKILSMMLITSLITLCMVNLSVSAADIVMDDFEGSALSEAWTWVNQDLHNDTVSDGHLILNSEVVGANSSENMAYLQQALTDDFEAVVKFKPNATTGDGQEAGIFIWQNWNDKFRFFVSGKGSNYMILNHDNNTSGWPQIVPDNDGYVYFKVVREGNKYTFSYSRDGLTYTQKHVQELDYTDVHFGVYAIKQPSNPEFQAEFDYVKISSVNNLVDQDTINELPEDIPDENKLNIVSLTPREDIVLGQTMTVKFNNEIASTPNFRVSRDNTEVEGAIVDVEQVDAFTYSFKISEDAQFEEGAVYTLYAETTDIYGNSVKNNAAFKIFKSVNIPEDAADKYPGYVYDVKNSDEFNESFIDSKWSNSSLAQADGSQVLFEIEPGKTKTMSAKVADKGDAIIEVKATLVSPLTAHDDRIFFQLDDGNGSNFRIELANNMGLGYLITTQAPGSDPVYTVYDSQRQTKDIIVKSVRQDGALTVDISVDGGRTWLNTAKNAVWTDSALNIKIGGEIQAAAQQSVAVSYDYVRTYVPEISKTKLYVNDELIEDLVAGQYNVSAETTITDYSGNNSYIMISSLCKKDENGVWENVAVACSETVIPVSKTVLTVQLPVDIQEGSERDYEVKTYLWDGLSLEQMHSIVAEKGENPVNVASIKDITSVYSEQGYMNVSGTLDSDDSALLTVMIKDEADNIVHVEERQVKGSKDFSFNIKLNDDLSSGKYTISVASNEGTMGVSDEFAFVTDTEGIVAEINESLKSDKTIADLIAVLTKYSDELGLDVDQIQATRQSTYLQLKEHGDFEQLSVFKNEYSICENLCKISEAGSLEDTGVLVDEIVSLMYGGEETDYSKLTNKEFVFGYMYNSSDRKKIDAQNKELFVSIFEKAVAVEMLNEITNANRSSIVDIISKYSEQLTLNSSSEWNYYNGLSANQKETIAISIAAGIIAGGTFEDEGAVRDTFDSVVSKYKNDNEKPSGGGGGGGGGGGSSSSSSSGSWSEESHVLPPVIENNTKPDSENKSVIDIFNDLYDCEWAVDYIQILYDKNIVDGISENKFAPNENITREQYVKLLVEALNIEDAGDIDFADVSKEHWAYGYIARAVNSGIVNGISETEFGTGQYITRQDMATMAFRAIEYVSDVSFDQAQTNFDDDELIAPYAKAAVGYFNEKNVIDGKGENKFDPQANATRAEAVKIIVGILELV